MFKQLSLEDQQQLFNGCLLIWKGRFVKVLSVGATYRLFDLADQKEVLVQAPYKDFTPPYKRIGMVNTGGSCIFVMRTPTRQYQVGYSSHNCRYQYLPVNYPDGQGLTRDVVRALTSKAVHDALVGQYPSLKEALSNAAMADGACAFDKQFAVDHARNVFFKDKKVGSVPSNRVGISSIRWNDGQEYLSLLLEKNHEKDLRTVASKL